MSYPYSEIYADADRVMAGLGAESARRGAPVTCARGCFHCCYEPMYAERTEVVNLLEVLSADERVAVRSRTADWVQGFERAGLHRHGVHAKDFGSLLKYRSARLACPLLDRGECIGYSRRPFGCRTHAAIGPAVRCADNHTRPKQTFLQVPPALSISACLRMAAESRVTIVEFDHLGVLLANLQGIDAPQTKVSRQYLFETAVAGGEAPAGTSLPGRTDWKP